MPENAGDQRQSRANDIIDAVAAGQQDALEAVRKFVDAVDDAIPNVGGDDEPPVRRDKIIDAAFDMIERLLSVSNDFARDLVQVTEKTLSGARGTGDDSTA